MAEARLVTSHLIMSDGKNLPFLTGELKFTKSIWVIQKESRLGYFHGIILSDVFLSSHPSFQKEWADIIGNDRLGFKFNC